MGIIVMAAISIVAFRRARAAGRNGLLWVFFVWTVGIAVGWGLAAIGACVDLLTSPGINSIVPFVSFWGMAVGNTIGSIAVAVRAGHPNLKLSD